LLIKIWFYFPFAILLPFAVFNIRYYFHSLFLLFAVFAFASFVFAVLFFAVFWCNLPANVMEVQKRVEDTICRHQLQANIQSDNKQETKFYQLKKNQTIKLSIIFKIWHNIKILRQSMQKKKVSLLTDFAKIVKHSCWC
jgi:hypothetical protein